MKRFVITGAPGAGKTAIIRHLELDGFGWLKKQPPTLSPPRMRGSVEPWRDPAFIDAIAGLQREREIRSLYLPDRVQFHDRSVVCTAALAVYLGYPLTPCLTGEVKRIRREEVY